nr:hypothetical protein [Tanacetum cinerariifolium]
MSGSGPGEMAPTSTKVVVFPKFDMHVYTSELTTSELKAVVVDYFIPMDLHPRLPPPGMTMDRLPSWYIGLYVEQLEQGGLRVPFSSFFLVVIKHSGVHVSQLVPMGVNRNKTGRGTRKCFKEVTTSFKGWKRKNFLIDRRAIPDVMHWRHGDTDLYDDFPTNFNQDDVECLSEFSVPLWPPSRHLLYVCGLTTACWHPGLSYSIKDQDKNVISMDTFLKLLTWTGTIVSKGDPIPEDQRPKPRVTPSLLEGSNIPNLTAFQRSAGGSRKKQKVQKQNEPTQSESEETLSAGSIRQAHPEAAKKPATPSPPLDHHDVDENPDPDKKELLDMVNELGRERDEWRATASDQVEQIRHLERDLEPKTQQLMAAEKKVKMLEHKRLALSAQLSQSEADRKKLVKDFIPTVVKRLHTSVEYRKNLAAPKIADSCDLPLSELWSVHPDAPSPEGVTLGAAAKSTIQQPSSTSLKTTSDISFETTT